jgi:serine/threonine protein kinase
MLARSTDKTRPGARPRCSGKGAVAANGKYKQEMTDNRLLAIAYGIVKGMCYLHKNHVCHRDLKSHNVLYDQQLRVKLCDFAFSSECTPITVVSASSPSRPVPDHHPLSLTPQPDQHPLSLTPHPGVALPLRPEFKVELEKKSVRFESRVGTPQWMAPEVSRPFPSWNRSTLTEIYLCHACSSCQEIVRAETAGQVLRGEDYTFSADVYR